MNGKNKEKFSMFNYIENQNPSFEWKLYICNFNLNFFKNYFFINYALNINSYKNIYNIYILLKFKIFFNNICKIYNIKIWY